MDILFNLTFAFTLCFIVIVVLVKLFTKKNYEEAIQICVVFLKSMVSTFNKEITAPPPTPLIYFPVFIGTDEWGNLIPKLIRKYFSPFEKFWEIVDFNTAGYVNAQQNIIFYQLNCVKLKQDIVGNELIDLIQNLAESCLKHYLQDYGYMDVPVKQIVAIKFINDTVTIYIACTSEGISGINFIREKIQASCSKKNRSSQIPPLDTSWEDIEN